MSEIFIKTLERLPELLIRNAFNMMQRIVSAMQTALEKNRDLENPSFCALTLRMGSEDLAREFAEAIKKRFVRGICG